ncbi:MAG: hypothetical protein RMJ98_11495 [Myxococcales bacterium]|nr:hypothetical protein [Polyangiaceae bacterium]MDW8249912.1 hypothetical protein [Myxococcales bacterium]
MQSPSYLALQIETGHPCDVVVRSFGYPAVIVLLLIGVVPAWICVHHHQQTLAKTAHYREHLTASSQGAIHLVGQVHGQTMLSPGEQQCLAYNYWIRRGNGRSSLYFCSHGQMMPLELTTSQGDKLSIAADKYKVVITQAPRLEQRLNHRPLDVPCPDAKETDTLVENCLRPGDTVEIWACREPGTNQITRCYDGVDEIISPPSGGFYRKIQRQTRIHLGLSLLWACLWGLAALMVLSPGAVFLSRRPLCPIQESCEEAWTRRS